MGVNLQKGQRISLDKEANGSLTRIVMGLGWDAAKAKTSGFLGSLFGRRRRKHRSRRFLSFIRRAGQSGGRGLVPAVA